jgi:UDPglucose--hexose-1-phosphate uridylyltransferase
MEKNIKHKTKSANREKFPSELRFALISRDWVVVATGRAKRPEAFKSEKRRKTTISQKDCFFCNIETQLPPILISRQGKIDIFSPNDHQSGGIQIPKDWTIVVIPNKYPAFVRMDGLNIRKKGLHQIMNAYGAAEVVVTRHHTKQLAQFTLEQIKELLDVYQARYVELMKEPHINYVSIFHNHGEEAGASVSHPHSQIIAAPVIDPKIKRSLFGAKSYFEHYKKCAHCEMNKWDVKHRERVVFENKEFLVVCPFASKSAFEMSITPKEHLPYFERITDAQKHQLAEAFFAAIRKLYKGLADPPYNFYLQTAPCDGRNHDYYHWHWVIAPKTSILAGFEMSTGIEISTIRPEEAAEYLKKQSI